MSESPQTDRTRELGELFVSITGDDSVTERQTAGEPSKEPREASNEFEVIEDGLQGAVDADLEPDAA
jgi:hypothetical protein